MDESTDQIMTVSTSFHPGAHPVESDLVLSSSDGVLFYVHASTIEKASPTALPSFLSFSTSGIKEDIIPIPEPATVLNIILHTIYQSTCAQNLPTSDDLIEAIDRLPRFGIEPSTLVRPDTPIYQLILSHAPLRAIDVYAMAAHHDLRELAEASSSHLLAYSLETLSDEMAAKMGPFYLKRLFLLHMTRTEEAKRILLQPPSFHPVTKECSFEDQRKVTRAWALGTTYLAWDVRPGLSLSRIQSVFEPLVSNMECTACQNMVKKRIREVVTGWAAVKVSLLR
ncbi:hypothetical protein MD484_g1525, partial [Candolleomyces efflorescens]